jgi:tagatose 6-phosphate kinase
MILCLGTTPAAQRVMVFDRLNMDAVNRATSTLDGIAGKSINVAKVLQVLGGEPLAVGFLGGLRGQEIEAELRRRGLNCEFVPVNVPTRQCVTVIDRGSGSITELVEESKAAQPEAFEQLMNIVQRRVIGCAALVLSGTIATGGPTDLYARCVDLAHANGAVAVVDASGAALIEALRQRPDLVKPNRAELERTVGTKLCDEKEVVAAIRELHSRGAKRVIVTAGREPTLAFDGVHFWRISNPVVRALNPIGSGDAFTAGLVWRLTEGDSLGEGCRWAAAAGAANALTWMAGEVEKPEVERLLPEVRVEQMQ